MRWAVPATTCAAKATGVTPVCTCEAELTVRTQLSPKPANRETASMVAAAMAPASTVRRSRACQVAMGPSQHQPRKMTARKAGALTVAAAAQMAIPRTQDRRRATSSPTRTMATITRSLSAPPRKTRIARGLAAPNATTWARSRPKSRASPADRGDRHGQRADGHQPQEHECEQDLVVGDGREEAIEAQDERPVRRGRVGPGGPGHRVERGASQHARPIDVGVDVAAHQLGLTGVAVDVEAKQRGTDHDGDRPDGDRLDHVAYGTPWVRGQELEEPQPHAAMNSTIPP